MKTCCLRIAAASLALVLGATFVMAAPVADESRRAECEREAKAMHFGIHFIKRAHFMKNCMARK